MKGKRSVEEKRGSVGESKVAERGLRRGESSHRGKEVIMHKLGEKGFGSDPH